MPSPGDHAGDRELVRTALLGEQPAVEALVSRLRCIPRILVALNNRTGRRFNAEDLRDLEQDTLATLWPRIQAYTGQASLETWAYGFCFNGFMNVLRKQGRRVAVQLEELEAATDGDGPASSLDYEHLHRGLEQLDEREAVVIRLKYFEELTFEEIGRRLGSSANTTKTVYYRGMRRLETLLRATRQEEPR